MTQHRPLTCGKDRPLNVDQANSMPNVRSALNGWMRPVTFIQRSRKVVSGGTVHVGEIATQTRAMLQPFSSEQLSVLPEGERSWQWWTIHAVPEPALLTGDLVVKGNLRLKIMSKTNYAANGFVEYAAVEVA